MEETNWRRLEEIFAAAVELSGTARTDLVALETAGDSALREQLLELLRHADGAQERIAAVIEAAAQTVGPSRDWPGQRFGPYRVVREIGRGGMGIVFEAVRDDAEYNKRVALKVAGALRHRDALRERFLQERQILAELEHPRIARFLDGGTEQGLPYFAMEFVEGLPVTQYCRERNLSVADRVKLFREICEAIEYAHGRLIVHRDLKPGNILVAADGRPKVLDFGIAKLLGEAGPGAQTTGMALWTPDYASPEQVRGQTITTRSDVYALGLILYEMLSGKPAQVADTSSPLALDRSVCEAEVRPPSEVTDEASASILQGDLDCIISKAIEKEPERRYPSVTALSEDLRRYLAGEPVLAQPATRRYRLVKFVKRNRVAIAAAVAIGLSVAGGTAVSVVQARRAERRFQQVRQLANTFLFDFHDRIENLEGATAARQFVAATAMQYLDSLALEAGGDEQLLLELATAYDRLGAVQGRMGSASLRQQEEALASYGKAVHLAGQVLESNPNHRQALRLAVRALADRAGIELHSARRADAAAASLRMALLFSERLMNAPGVPLDPDDIRNHQALLIRKADQIVATDPKAAVALYRDVIDRGERVLATVGTAKDRIQVAVTCSRLQRALLGLGDPRGARAILEKGLQLMEPALAADPQNTRLRTIVSSLLSGIGSILGDAEVFHLNEPAKALAVLQRVVRMELEATSADGKNRNAQENLAIALLRLAAVQVLSDAATARETARDGWERARRLRDAEPSSPRFAHLFWNGRTMLAQTHLALREPAQVAALYGNSLPPAKEALARYGNDLGELESVLRDHLRLVEAYIQMRQWDKAARHLGESALMIADLTKRYPNDLYFLRDHAWQEEAEGDLAAARRDKLRARERWQSALQLWEKWRQLALAPSPYPEGQSQRLQKKIGNLGGA